MAFPLVCLKATGFGGADSAGKLKSSRLDCLNKLGLFLGGLVSLLESSRVELDGDLILLFGVAVFRGIVFGRFSGGAAVLSGLFLSPGSVQLQEQLSESDVLASDALASDTLESASDAPESDD